MTEQQKKPSRLELVRSGQKFDMPRTGRLIVGIQKIVEDPNNERKTFRNMEGLTASIKTVGLIEPVTVIALADDRYQIITGHRRYRAAKAAGLETVEVLIREPDEEKVRRQKSLISNIQREDIGPVEMAEALQDLLDDDNEIESQAGLAKAIGKGKVWVSSMLRVLALPPHLRTKVQTSELSIPYDAVINIARIDSPEVQEQLIDELLAGGSVRDIRDRIADHKGQARKPRDGEERPAPKPKRVYRTEQKAVVIVQSETKSLSPERVISALQEALKLARKGTDDN